MQVPPNAVFFSLWRLHENKGKDDKGRRFKNVRRERVRGAPDDNGVIVDLWPVADLDAIAIVEAFGPGRYRVAFHGGDGNVGKEVGKGQEFELTRPPRRPGKLGRTEAAAPAPPTTERDVLAAAASGRPIGVVELLALLDAQRERAEAAARVAENRAIADAERRQTQDREFFAMILNARNAPAAAAPVAVVGPGVDFAREMQLMRRELALTLREETSRIREEVADELAEGDGPETAGEALNEVGVAAVTGLGDVAPGLVRDAVTAVQSWMRSKGQTADAASVAKIAGAVRAVMEAEAGANGAGGGSHS